MLCAMTHPSTRGMYALPDEPGCGHSVLSRNLVVTRAQPYGFVLMVSTNKARQLISRFNDTMYSTCNFFVCHMQLLCLLHVRPKCVPQHSGLRPERRHPNLRPGPRPIEAWASRGSSHKPKCAKMQLNLCKSWRYNTLMVLQHMFMVASNGSKLARHIKPSASLLVA